MSQNSTTQPSNIADPASQPVQPPEAVQHEQAAQIAQAIQDAQAVRQAQAAADTALRHNQAVEGIKEMLKIRNLAICVGAGVSIYSTADATGRPVDRLTWKGLIRHGLQFVIETERMNPTQLSKEMRRAFEDIDSDTSTTKELLGAATTVRDMLKKTNRFPTWIDGVFKDLPKEIRHPSILNALRRLHENGATLLTTNYDALLESVCNVPAVDGSQKEELDDFSLKRSKAIFHPHGYYKRSSKVVFDAFDYYGATRDPEVQAVLKNLLLYHTVLFVGCGKGLEDPNMGPLLEWVGKQQETTAHHHYILLRRQDDRINGPLIEVFYGDDYEDLGPWLERLLGDENSTPEGTMNDIPNDSERRKIHDWLSPIDQTRFHCDMLDKQNPDTGLWFRHILEYKMWLFGASSYMWVYGSEDGCGKTILCSSIIKAVQEGCRQAEPARSRDSIAYFYFSSKSQSQQQGEVAVPTFRDFLSAVVSQLCPPNSFFQALRKLYQDCTHKYPGRPPTSFQLEQTLIDILKQLNSTTETFRILVNPTERPTRTVLPGETFLIMDGLDAMPSVHRDRILRFLLKVQGLALEHLHILVVSQDKPSIRKALSSSNTWHTMEIGDLNVRSDIESYIWGVMEENFELNDQSDEIKALILRKILRGDRNLSFRLVVEKMESLRRLDRIDSQAIREKLKLKAADLLDATAAPAPKVARLSFEDDLEISDKSTRETDEWFEDYERWMRLWIYPLADRQVAGRIPRLRIALLSTGIDLKDPYIQGSADRIAAIRTWVTENAEDNAGVGTHAAALLLKVAPEAEIYIAKIANSLRMDDSQSLENIVTEAVRYARHAWKVDILIIPFITSGPNGRLENELRLAQVSNILVFLAVPNTPPTTRDNWMIPSTAIVVGSNSGFKESSLSRNLDFLDSDLVTLGEAVESSWPRQLLRPGERGYTRRLSGNSVATVIAAGVVATFIFHLQHKLLGTRNFQLGSERLKQKQTLMGLLRLRGQKGPVHLSPFKLFNDSDELYQKILNAL